MLPRTRDPQELRRLIRQEIDRLIPFISQRRLEVLAGLSQGYLSRLRSGDGTPSATLVCALALLARDPKGRLQELQGYWEQNESSQLDGSARVAPEAWELTPQQLMTAIMDELRPPIHAALEDTESLTQVIEGALVDLTGAITQFRCSQRRIQGQVDSLRWLPALLQGNPVQLPKPAPCRLGSILSAITGSARYLQMDVPGDLHILAPLGVFDIALERLLYAVRHLAGPKTAITVSARAIDATQMTWPASAPVTLAGPAVLLTVKAESPFIPNDVRSHLLQPLPPVAEDAPGLGFGLWLSRRLVRSQGGDLWLDESSSGTIFHAVWPAVPEG